jgi:hypothetical protein
MSAPESPELLVRSCRGDAASAVLRTVLGALAAALPERPSVLLWVGDVAAVGGPLAVVLLEVEPPEAQVTGLLLPGGTAGDVLARRLLAEAEQAAIAAGCTRLAVPGPAGAHVREL